MLLKTNPEEIHAYLEDSSALFDGHTPGVYFPETYDDVQALLRRCNAQAAKGHSVHLTLSGNGTGTTGGRIPYGDYVLATNRFHRILSIQKTEHGGIATVQTGVLLADLQAAVEAEGLMYTPDPTERYCFIGGTIANNSSGARTFKYGATRPYILRLDMILPTGDRFELRRGEYHADESGTISFHSKEGTPYTLQIPRYTMPKTTKHVAGYYAEPGMDLIDLFIGSEGTLAVILEADVRLLPKPERLFSGLIYFSDEATLLDFVAQAASLSRNASDTVIAARAIEFFDRHSLAFLRKKFPSIPPQATGAIFFEQEVTAEREDAALQGWLELMEAHDALIDSSWIALTPDEQQRLRDFRHALPVLVNEWYSAFRQRKISTDMAVPLDRFRELYDTYCSVCAREEFNYILFGHIGDAHLHLNILPKDASEAERARTAYRGFITKTLELGGTISAEHGVGKLKSEYLVDMYGEEGIADMVGIKAALDPHFLLNRGNLIPSRYLNR